jgi:hypothetical protein
MVTLAPPPKVTESRASRVWFGIMATAWAIFYLGLALFPDRLVDVWDWVAGLPLVGRVIAWLVALPWMVGLWIWTLDWGQTTRIVVITVVALAWILASVPRKRSA